MHPFKKRCLSFLLSRILRTTGLSFKNDNTGLFVCTGRNLCSQGLFTVLKQQISLVWSTTAGALVYKSHG